MTNYTFPIRALGQARRIRLYHAPQGIWAAGFPSQRDMACFCPLDCRVVNWRQWSKVGHGAVPHCIG